ncbi:MAG: HAD-IB family hydrolase [Calditrichaeota bacterium]|nr:HAD-IB family hydrolase [Calditrichota bacterium]
MAKLQMAVFDVDGTLIPHTSLEILFSRWLFRKKQMGFRQIQAFLIHVFYGLREDTTEAFRRNKFYLRGLSLKKLQASSNIFFEEEIRPRLLQNLVDRMEVFHSEGKQNILLSGSLHFLLENLQSHLPVDTVIGAHLEEQNGILTGRIEGIHPYGKDKVRALQDVFDFHQIDFSNSWAFGDRWSDRYLLRLFGHCGVVNPGIRLGEWARAHHCEIIQTAR